MYHFISACQERGGSRLTACLPPKRLGSGRVCSLQAATLAAAPLQVVLSGLDHLTTATKPEVYKCIAPASQHCLRDGHTLWG